MVQWNQVKNRQRLCRLAAYLVDVRPDQVVQLVEDAVDDFDQQVPLLVLQGGRHQQRQDLIEQRPGAKLPGFVGDLPQCSLGNAEGKEHKTAVTGLDALCKNFLKSGGSRFVRRRQQSVACCPIGTATCAGGGGFFCKQIFTLQSRAD